MCVYQCIVSTCTIMTWCFCNSCLGKSVSSMSIFASCVLLFLFFSLRCWKCVLSVTGWFENISTGWDFIRPRVVTFLRLLLCSLFLPWYLIASFKIYASLLSLILASVFVVAFFWAPAMIPHSLCGRSAPLVFLLYFVLNFPNLCNVFDQCIFLAHAASVRTMHLLSVAEI